MNGKLKIGMVCAAAVGAAGLAGCVNVSGSRAPDGTLTIKSHRFLWTSEGIDFSVQDETNLVVTLKVQKSNADAQALGAIAEGVAKGVATGVKP